MPSAPALYPSMCKEYTIDAVRVADAAESHELANARAAHHADVAGAILLAIATPCICVGAGLALLAPRPALKAGITGALLWGAAAAADTISKEMARRERHCAELKKDAKKLWGDTQGKDRNEWPPEIRDDYVGIVHRACIFLTRGECEDTQRNSQNT